MTPAVCRSCGQPRGTDRRSCMCGLREVVKAVGREHEALAHVADAAREAVAQGAGTPSLVSAIHLYDEAVAEREAL